MSWPCQYLTIIGTVCLQQFGQIAFKALLLIFAIGVLTPINPFNLVSSAEGLSSRIFYLAAGASYPSDYSDEITVVLADFERLSTLDIGLGPLNIDWPPPYRTHADILDVIAEYKPRALFLDFLFTSQRDDASITFLSEAVAQFPAPIFFAGQRHDSDGDRRPLRPELDVFSQVYTPTADNDRFAVFYELFDCRSQRPSAALAVVTAIDPLRRAEWSQITCSERGAPELEIYWPSNLGAHADLPQNRLDLCKDQPRSFGAMTRDIWRWAFIYSLVPWLAGKDSIATLAALEQPCPPYRTIGADMMLRASDQTLWHDAFADRIVIYGGIAPDTNDTIFPPTHTRLPGAYFHAAAIDNLLQFHRDSPVTSFAQRSSLGMWIVALIMFIAIAIPAALVSETLATSFAAIARATSAALASEAPRASFTTVAGQATFTGICRVLANIVFMGVSVFAAGSAIYFVTMWAVYAAFTWFAMPPSNFVLVWGCISFRVIEPIVIMLRAILCQIAYMLRKLCAAR